MRYTPVMSNTIALLKKQELNTGVDAEYWKITGVSYVEQEEKSHVLLAGWVDEEKFKANKAVLAVVRIELSKELTDQIRFTGQFPTKQLLYQLVLGTSEFSGSVPILESADSAPVSNDPTVAPVDS